MELLKVFIVDLSGRDQIEVVSAAIYQIESDQHFNGSVFQGIFIYPLMSDIIFHQDML